VLVAAAAGNESARKLGYPAGYAVNISVGAIDKNNAHADFSNIGRGLDVSAPGVGVLSSVPRGVGSEAGVNDGTSDIFALGLEFAGHTAGLSRTLVSCGIGQTGEFPATVSGNIALIQRGTLSFADKVTNAMNAGAAGVIIYNNVSGDFSGTLGAATTADGRAFVPAVSVSMENGTALLAKAGSTVTLSNVVSDWDFFDGTSMATPHVCGVLALIWGATPSATNAQVESALESTATDLGAAGYDTTFGNGLINADAALASFGH
jgi:subtilisin family serine protease